MPAKSGKNAPPQKRVKTGVLGTASATIRTPNINVAAPKPHTQPGALFLVEWRQTKRIIPTFGHVILKHGNWGGILSRSTAFWSPVAHCELVLA